LASDSKPNKKVKVETSQGQKKKEKSKSKGSDPKGKGEDGDNEKEEGGDGHAGPPPFTKIRTSPFSLFCHQHFSHLIYLSDHYLRKRNNPAPDEIPECDCPKPPPGQMGCLNQCVNRYDYWRH